MRWAVRGFCALLLLIGTLQVLGKHKDTRKDHRVDINEFEIAQIEPSYIKRFERASTTDKYLYAIETIQLVTAMQMHIRVSNAPSKRVYFEKQMDCCKFISGIEKNILRRFYSQFVINSSFYCPFKPDRYLLRMEIWPGTIPTITPKGKFNIDVKLKLPNDTLLLNLIWRLTK